jgi:hypothetical protein
MDEAHIVTAKGMTNDSRRSEACERDATCTATPCQDLRSTRESVIFQQYF